MARLAIARLVSAPEEWNRRKLQVVLMIAGLVTATVAAGGAWSVASMLHGSPSTVSGQQSVDRRAPEDGIADADLPPATIEDAQPGPLSTGAAETITIPQPDALGPAQVQTGV
jgi:hypothetical protein